MALGPLRLPWVARHGDFQEGRFFTDVQERGPFARWRHTHRLLPAGSSACDLEDDVEYELPGGALGRLLAGAAVRRRLEAWFSWVALDDAVGAIHHALLNESLTGPVNVTAPGAVTNAELTKSLGKVLSRPTLASVPAFAARAALGEMADALLLASTRVEPKRLLESGYAFALPTLEPALRTLLGRRS